MTAGLSIVPFPKEGILLVGIPVCLPLAGLSTFSSLGEIAGSRSVCVAGSCREAILLGFEPEENDGMRLLPSVGLCGTSLFTGSLFSLAESGLPVVELDEDGILLLAWPLLLSLRETPGI